MKIISSIPEMQTIAGEVHRDLKKIGVVPTMGYLHEGHLSLMRIAGQHADVVITTIFVNPAQFAPNEDFSSYPRDLERDERLAESAGTDFLFIPESNDMYPSGYLTYVNVDDITTVLEGRVRPSHFRGVTTVVAKLFNITKPHIAVVGQKDAQQAAVIKQMVRDLNFDIEVIVAPIVREADGLAMSSRNVYLSPDERRQSIVLSESLKLAERLIAGGENVPDRIRSEMMKLITARPSVTVDYISIADPVTLEEQSKLPAGGTVLVSLAVRIGKTRIIDNSLVGVAK